MTATRDEGDGGAPEGDSEPDVRFTYANERTFLAWIRTSLALMATGLAATQLLPAFDITYARRIIGIPLILLGAVIAAVSFRNWGANQRAMRRGDPLPHSVLPTLLAVGLIVIATLAGVLAAAFGK